MLVSVIITNYNYGRFLGQAIDSVLAQTHKQVECIVVDDGSTDNSREIIESRRGVIAIFKQNGGQAKALKTGLDAAKGEIVISLDSDDYLYPDACARVVDAWSPGVSCLNYRLSLNGDPAQSWPAEPFLDEGHVEFLAANGYYPSPPMSGNAFARDYARALLARGDGLNGDGVDAYLLYSAPFFGKIAHVDKPLGVYRTHGGNVSMTSGRKTVRNLGDHAYYQYWAQQNAQRFALERGFNYPQRSYLVGAYPSLWLLAAKDAGYDRRPLPQQNRLLTTFVAIKGFLLQPGMSLASRLKNVALLLAMAPLPLALRQKIADRALFNRAPAQVRVAPAKARAKASRAALGRRA